MSTIGPPKGKDHDELHPIQENESGDLEVETDRAKGGRANEEADAEWATLEANVEDLQRRLAEHVQDSNGHRGG